MLLSEKEKEETSKNKNTNKKKTIETPKKKGNNNNPWAIQHQNVTPSPNPRSDESDSNASDDMIEETSDDVNKKRSARFVRKNDKRNGLTARQQNAKKKTGSFVHLIIFVAWVVAFLDELWIVSAACL